jgi:uncharacterized DUF497 family protein
VRITFDADKRDWTLAKRGLDFADAAEVFAGVTLDRDTASRGLSASGSYAAAR